MRILIVSGSFHGHVNTLLPLALAARDAGHDLAFATGPDLAPEVLRRGLAAWAVGAAHASLCGEGTPSSWLAYFESAAERRLQDLLPRTAAWQPDLVVHEETELAGPVVAALTCAQPVIHGLSVMPSVQQCAVFMEAAQRLADRWGAGQDMVRRMREAPYLHVCPSLLEPDRERPWERVLPIRPAMGTEHQGERLPAALDAMPFDETLHLTLGTVFHGHHTVLASAIEALRDLPYNLVVATGPGSDPARFGPQPRHVLLAPYLPHRQLLPRCRLIVSQGGAGILFGGLAHGLPQLVLPQGADQFENAEACVRAGAGLALKGERVTPQGMREAVLRLLYEPSFARRAQAVSVEIAAMPAAPSVLEALTAQVRETRGAAC